MQMLKYSLAIFAALFVNLAALGMDIKGIEPGKTNNDEMPALLGESAACTPREEGSRELLPGWQNCILGYGFTLAGVGGEVMYYLDERGTVQLFSFFFAPSDFDQVLQSAVAKWGKPSKAATGVVSNMAGTKFQQKTAEWDKQGVLILMEKRGDRVTKSRLTAFAQTYFARRKAWDEKKKKGDF